MRRYTENPFISNQINTADGFNDDLRPIVEALNGGLDMHNLPLAEIGESHIEDTVVTTTSDLRSAVGAFNNYHRLATRTSTLTFDPTVTNTFSAWNDIEGDFNLTFQAVEGMILGSVVVTGNKMATQLIRDGFNIEVGTAAAWDIRVLCNDIEIAYSGYIPAGIYTLDLPFSTPIGNQGVIIKAQYRLINFIDSDNDWDYPSFKITTRHMWARNCFR